MRYIQIIPGRRASRQRPAYGQGVAVLLAAWLIVALLANCAHAAESQLVEVQRTNSTSRFVVRLNQGEKIPAGFREVSRSAPESRDEARRTDRKASGARSTCAGVRCRRAN